MKRNGFTLIELLAVIVVLAIIAVIATPIVLNTIDDAKKGAAKSSAYSYIEEIETEVSSYMIKNNGARYAVGKYNVEALKTDLGVEVKGDAPSEGNICIASNGTVSKASIKINGYVVSYDGKEVTTTDEKEVENFDCEGPILDKVKTLVYDENGVCKTDGTTYNYMGGCYIKGAFTNNYVWYNGFMWRIMGINSDNTVRLITDENVTVLQLGPWYSGLSYKNTKGYVHDWLNEYFYNNLNNTKDIIQEGPYFCRNSTNSSRDECESGNEVITKIGLISYIEYGLSDDFYNPSYLDIGQEYWTITPSDRSYGLSVRDSSSGPDPMESKSGVRPVINILSTATITAGDGTTSNFYVLGEDKSIDVTGKISEKATSGEYVKLEGKIYRVVSKNSQGVKLILDGFYEETEGTIYTMKYNETTENNIFTTSSGIGQKLNTDVLAWLGLTSSDYRLADSSIYYQGDGFDYYSGSYINTLKQSNGVEAPVGLIQAGDILASHSATMLTKNYEQKSNSQNIASYWLINKYASETNVWYIENDGESTSSSVLSEFAIRPVIMVKNDLNIISGNGTWKKPYEIS